jgi:hypothetical protein
LSYVGELFVRYEEQQLTDTFQTALLGGGIVPPGTAVTTTTLLEGIVPLPVAAAAIKRHPTTVRRWAKKPGGPPLIFIGREPHLDLAKFRKWIEAQVRVVAEPEPVRRGRQPGAKDRAPRMRKVAE